MNATRDTELERWEPRASSPRGRRIETFVRTVLIEAEFATRLEVSPVILVDLGNLKGSEEAIVVGFPRGPWMKAANHAATGRQSPPSAREFREAKPDPVEAWVEARKAWHRRRREAAADWLAHFKARLVELGCVVSDRFDSHGTLHSLTVERTPKARRS